MNPRKLRNAERGQALLLTLVGLICLFGFLALGVDVGILFRAKRVLQTAADSAAIAGAAEIQYGDVTTAAQAVASQNGVTNGSNGATVTVNNPPLGGPHSGNANYVEVIASQSNPTFFMGLFNRSAMTVTARAVAHWGVSRSCIVTLGSSGTDVSVTTSGSNPTLNAPLCGISVDSSSGSALQVVSSGDPTPIVANSIGIVGNYSETGGTISPTPTTGIVPVSDPLAYLQPPPAGACLPNPNVVASGGTVNIPVGNYCSGISIVASSTTVNFAAGTYTIGGSGLSIIGSSITINGTGVTFYLSSGGVSITPSGSTFNLTAPTTGTYNGVLFYQSRSDTTGASITESGSTSVLNGVLYFPDAPLTFTASGSSTSLYLAFVTKSLSLTTSSTTLNDYASLYGTSPLGAPILVE